MSLLKNPLLPGFYPDPSILRVDDDFYMVTSSFSYYPGVPIFHSKDLANWEQIGHILDRPEQLPLTCTRISGGIFAPTLRFHDGLYYMITTNVSYGGNFIVTAEKPEGPWSEAHWIENAEGIDPSLFWDDDGKAYYTGTGHNPATNVQGIWISEIDLKEFKLVGEKKFLWDGAYTLNAWPEASHIYKVNGYYYLMIAEGGTEHFHSETIARSENLMGPYVSYRGNPILTQRHLGLNADIANTGHADLVELKDGSWYIVFLASRPYGGYHKNLGRETFIAPVTWEDGWPIVSAGTGRILMEYPGPDLPEVPVETVWGKDDFDDAALGYAWNTLGTPDADTYYVKDGCLNLKVYESPLGMGMEEREVASTETGNGGKSLYPKVQPETLGYLARRQQHMSFKASAELISKPVDTQTAGIALIQNNYQQLRVELGVKDGQTVARAIRGHKSLDITLVHRTEFEPYTEDVLAEIPWNAEKTTLTIECTMQDYSLSVTDEAGRTEVLVPHVDGGFLGSETAGGFVGAYVGMFASGNGKAYEGAYMSFDSFTYQPK